MIICRITTKDHIFYFENGVVNLKANNKSKTLEIYVHIEIIKSYSKKTKEFDHKNEVYHFTIAQEDVLEVLINNRLMNKNKLFQEKKL